MGKLQSVRSDGSHIGLRRGTVRVAVEAHQRAGCVNTAAARMTRIRQALEAQLEPSSVEIHDDSAAHVGHAGAREGGHFRVSIVSTRFRGHGRVERHRIVYAAVAPLMGTDIHALNIVARTPEEAT